MGMRKTELHTGWTVRATGGPVPPEIAERTVPATVPGTVHTDLLDAGLIPDPYLGENEGALAWFHRTSWRYDTVLRAEPAAPGERLDLVFDGLDTVATIELDGVEIGRTANMHRGYRFDVSALVTGEDQTLTVRFASALEYAERLQDEIGERPRPYPHPFNAVRKMACSFGWDWGPDLQTAGIWKAVRLERWQTARITAVRPLATRDHLTVVVDVERAAGVNLVAEIYVGEHGRRRLPLPAAAGSGTVEIDVEDAPLWWPIGYGDQTLVPITVKLLYQGDILDRFDSRVGFRDVRLDETPDEHGSAFTLVVNDQPIFVRGLNWIPDDHLLTRITCTTLERAVNRAALANANLLRVWGGGIWESDDFYDVCDEQGILVWQDFPLACAAYAEEEPIRSEILAEARENVTRLVPHPSLILWNGGNENIWGHEDWGWKEALGDLTWGARYYYEDFPALLAALDPTRPYHPGSPSSPLSSQAHPNDDRYGTRHEWEAWNREDYTFHDQFVPRFCSEFGWQAPPAWATLESSLDAADLRKDSAAFLLHQKAEGGNAKLDAGITRHMRLPDDFGDWHWAAQLNQARATRHAVLHLRSHAPRTMGSILWQLNDCWPVTSWAVVDGAGRLKPAWYALRAAYEPRALGFVVRDGGPVLAAVNDSDARWESRAQIRLIGFDGKVVEERWADLEVPARGVSLIPVGEPLPVGDPARTVLVADAGSLRATHLFAEDYDLAFDPSPVEVSVRAVDTGYEVTVSASAYTRDLALLVDRLAPDAVVDEMLVDLLPGESRTFSVTTTATLDPAAFAAPEVLRSANSLTG
ncbi:beta-mannosidase [Actinoplanes lutulentus]|uniref:beta-mannosidase n=2 Tax=Actinoplanes lutulentus TaxID=1287878 RepID=A0A327ZGQ7_9ACTN|nr:beta-mannosidase [Actinoplanes lutulentus]